MINLGVPFPSSSSLPNTACPFPTPGGGGKGELFIIAVADVLHHAPTLTTNARVIGASVLTRTGGPPACLLLLLLRQGLFLTCP